MPKLSAGLLLYRRVDDDIEVLVAHPGGPIWARRDTGAWSIPKGAPRTTASCSIDAAYREFEEETGHPPPAGEAIDLGEVRMRSGKVVHGWAIEGDLDPADPEHDVEVEWPPRTGRIVTVPEIDRVAWVRPAEARRRLNPAQASFVDRLLQALARALTFDGRADGAPPVRRRKPGCSVSSGVPDQVQRAGAGDRRDHRRRARHRRQLAGQRHHHAAHRLPSAGSTSTTSYRPQAGGDGTRRPRSRSATARSSMR